MEREHTAGHMAAAVTVVIWGMTFISTKILLRAFLPIEILLLRFLIGALALTVACPKRLKTGNVRQELTFVAAGLSGICLYYLLENIALSCTLASNVGVIISVAPFFTAILAHVFLKSEERLRAGCFVGFAVAMAGICLISFQGGVQFSPLGDLLALLAALVWAVYSLLTLMERNHMSESEAHRYLQKNSMAVSYTHLSDGQPGSMGVCIRRSERSTGPGGWY